MKQNQRLLTTLVVVAVGVGALLWGGWYLNEEEPAVANAAAVTGPLRFIEGRNGDYLEVDNPLPARGGKLEVELFFWYGCPACYATDPAYNNWAKGLPDDVVFIRTPAIFARIHEIHGRLHYSIQALGMDEDAMANRVYREIHEKRNQLASEQQILGFLVRTGQARTAAEQVFRSFALAAKIREARERGKRLMVSGTPALTVGGRYRINTASPGRATAVADFLLNKMRNEQAQN